MNLYRINRILIREIPFYQNTSTLMNIKFASNFKRPDLNLLKNTDRFLSIRKQLENQSGPLSNNEWKTIRNEILCNQKYINMINVDAAILGICHSESNLIVAKSYMEFLKNEKIEPNYATLGRLMRIYYSSYKNDRITDEDKKEIMKIYKNIRQKHEILDSTTCENLIHGLLATTDNLEDSLELLDMIQITSKPSANAYSLIISHTFKNSRAIEIGFKLLREMVANNRIPKCEIFIEYFKTIKDNVSFKENSEKMLQFIGTNDIKISRKVANYLMEVFNELNLNIKITAVSKNGKCMNCGLLMENISISNDEFKKLQTTFLDKVLIRKDAFIRTSPEEVEKFRKFIENTMPYDCVIDGLNVAFSTGVNKHPSTFAKLLASVVRYFAEKQKRILVIGRKHMNRFPQQQMNYIRKNSNMFLTNDLTQDDPFLLYAALKSGPRTDFFSRDLMRSHAFLLGTNLKSIFRHWQQQHQYSLIAGNDYGNILIKQPIKYCVNAHRIDSVWHIPFREEYSPNPADSYEIQNFNWLCISFK